MEKFREIESELTIPGALTLLYAVEAQTQLDIEKKLKFSNASTSRNVAGWTNIGKNPGKPGHDYITQTIDPSDRRQRLISVNNKGMAFLRSLEEILETPSSDPNNQDALN